MIDLGVTRQRFAGVVFGLIFLALATFVVFGVSACAREELLADTVEADLVGWQIALGEGASVWEVAAGALDIVELTERSDGARGRNFDARFEGVQRLTPGAEMALSGTLRLGYSEEAGVWHLRAVENFGITRTPIGDLARSLETVQLTTTVGTALFSWLTDQFGGAAAAGQNTFVDLSLYPDVGVDAVRAVLVPDYLDSVPEQDPWGRPFRFALSQDLLAERVMSIASGGRDATFSPGPYQVGRFDAFDFDQDVVWADGFFIRQPQALAETSSSW